MINDGQARRIASEWHGGQVSALYSLASCGAITECTRDEISDELQQLDVGRVRRDLLALDKYVRRNGARGPQSGWPTLWDDTETTIDQP
jgi:hypothetical protein